MDSYFIEGPISKGTIPRTWCVYNNSDLAWVCLCPRSHTCTGSWNTIQCGWVVPWGEPLWLWLRSPVNQVHHNIIVKPSVFNLDVGRQPISANNSTWADCAHSTPQPQSIRRHYYLGLVSSKTGASLVAITDYWWLPQGRVFSDQLHNFSRNVQHFNSHGA